MSEPRQLANSPQFIERRTLERIYDEMDAVYMPEKGVRVACKILDFSMMGARISLDEARVMSGEVSIHVPMIGLK